MKAFSLDSLSVPQSTMTAGSALLHVCVVMAAAAAVVRAVGPDLKARARDEDAAVVS